MLHIINNEHLINYQTETLYRLHTQIDSTQFPQVHDFYEIVLVVRGVLQLQLCGKMFSLNAGDLAFIRPGDIHTKAGSDCTHMNLAFLANTFNALFVYLSIEEEKAQFCQLPYVPPVHLSQQALMALEEKMQLLNTVSVTQWRKTRWIMRSILFEIVTYYLSPNLPSERSQVDMPDWLADALNAWHNAEHRQESLDFFCRHTGFTKEHICRSFLRYLGTTPTAYLNKQRINYAVNLLLHSDYSTLSIAYEAGFRSISRFYHVFHETYGISPKQFYLKQYNLPSRLNVAKKDKSSFHF